MVLTIVDVVLPDLSSRAKLRDISVSVLVALNILITDSKLRLRRKFGDLFLAQISIRIQFHFGAVFQSHLERFVDDIVSEMLHLVELALHFEVHMG